jgi:hypothetical protein
MGESMNLRLCLTIAAVAALGVIFTAFHAAAQNAKATIERVPANSSPPVPAGLKVTCLKDADQLQSSPTCPIVKYRGITTWAYSYIDNRVSMALVSYNRANQVIANVEMRGARYVVEARSDDRTQRVIFIGQAKQHVTAPWAALGPR